MNDMIDFDFQGRTAIVTGGARGIGRAIADRLAASGARVAIWDLLEPVPAGDLYTEPAEPYFSHRLDCTNAGEVQAAFDRSLEQLGKVDILVNGAGVAGPTKPIEDFSLDEWQRVIRINLDSVFLASKAVIPEMRRNGYGRIVSIASVAGKQGNPFMAGYSAAKGGVISLTKALALELADTGILVNCITPALIGTELLKEMSDEAIEISRRKIPLGRYGTLQEAAAMVAWIASDECGFTTGSAFDLSGGRASY
jgi:NAD(P)-dependent dehydrogenase (short-subunit alcohol dehydrogenase family)